MLAKDAARRIVVRVLLDKHYEQSANQPAFNYLADHDVSVRWAPARYDLTHEKAAVIDRNTALVMTLNLTVRYYATTRDFAVVDTEPADVSAIEAVFDADWSNQAISAPTGSDLVWSPGAEAALVALIAGARHSLLVENEEMDDRYITAPLESAARRGVDVDVVMTDSSEWSVAFDQLASAGVHVRTYAPSAALYIHAKAIVSDDGYPDAKAFLGSQNFSIASLEYNRELGIETTADPMPFVIGSVIQLDFAHGKPWP